VQGVALRGRDDSFPLTAPVAAFCSDVGQRVPFLDEDRPLENELRATVAAIRQRSWALYEHA